jgi:hypothetical protein
VVFPKNNLPVQSQPWTRDVEKRVENLESTFRSAEVNNATRDSQALSQIRRLDAAVTDVGIAAADASAAAATALAAANTANTSLNGLISLGTDGSTYSVHGGNITANTITANEINSGYVYAGTVNANQINAGTLTGFTIQTAPNGARAVLAGQNIGFFNSNETQAGIIAGGGAGGAVVNGVNVIAQQSLYLQGTGVEIKPTTGNLTVSSGSVIISTGGLNAGAIQGTSITGTSLNTGTVSLTQEAGNGRLIANTGVLCQGPLGVTQNFTYIAPIGTGTTFPLYWNSSTNLVYRLSSSERYKTNIADAEFDYEKLLQAKVRTFQNKQDVEENGAEAAELTYGYIAEELHDLGLTNFVVYESDENGNPRPESVNYMSMALAAHAMLQTQDAKLKALEARIEALEGGV